MASSKKTATLIAPLNAVQWGQLLQLNTHTALEAPVVNKSFLYQLAALPLRDIKILLEKEKIDNPSKLKKHLAGKIYGAYPAHFALLNPDLDVFKYIHGLYQECGLDIAKYQYVKTFRKTKFHKQTLLLPGESFFNLAFKLGDKEKMSHLNTQGLTNFALPLFPVRLQVNYDASDFTAPSSILSYCLHLCSGDFEIFGSREDKIKFYLDFAFSISPFEKEGEIFQKEKENFEYPHTQLLLYYPPLYQNPTFQALLPELVAHIIKRFQRSAGIFTRNGIPNVGEEVYQTILKNLTVASPECLKKLTHMVKKELGATQNWSKENKSMLNDFLSQLTVLKEKTILQQQLPSSTSNLNIVPKIYKI